MGIANRRALRVLGRAIPCQNHIRFAVPMVLKALGLVLIIAGLKLIGVY
jgi:hypothetical protein